MTRDKFEVRFLEIALFAGLSTGACEALKQIAVLYRLNAEETLISQGSSAQSFFIVQEGAMRLVRYLPNGKAVALKVYGKGDMFGLLALSGHFEHHAAVEAIGDTDVIAIPAKETRMLMHQYPDIALVLLDWIINHVHDTHQRIQTLASERTERRLARALLHFEVKFGIPTKSNRIINACLSQNDIAEFTATTPETVNRIFRAWKKEGYIDYSRNEIILLDKNALYQIAHEGEDSDVYLDRE